MSEQYVNFDTNGLTDDQSALFHRLSPAEQFAIAAPNLPEDPRIVDAVIQNRIKMTFSSMRPTDQLEKQHYIEMNEMRCAINAARRVAGYGRA